jgi:hypothetical protein
MKKLLLLGLMAVCVIGAFTGCASDDKPCKASAPAASADPKAMEK